MATAINDADEIRLQMAQIRRELHSDVREVVATAEAVTDWRRYIRMYPWAAVGAALALGYFVVPRRHKAVPVPLLTPADMAEVHETIEKNKATTHESDQKGKGLVGMAIGFLGPIAVRAAQGYAAQYLEQWLEQQQQQQQQQAARPSRSPSPGSSERTGGAAGRPPSTPPF